MENRLKFDKKVIVISVIVFFLIMYLLLLYNLNSRTAYKIDYNFEYACRREERDGIYYVTGAAQINVPHVRLDIGKWVMDEELGEEVDIGLTIEKNIFGQQDTYISLSCENNLEIADSIHLDEDFNYNFYDPDNVDHNEKLMGICERHKDLIDTLILEADKLWDIR